MHSRGRGWQEGVRDRGHAWQGVVCVAGKTIFAASGTYPTGMHPCLNCMFTLPTPIPTPISMKCTKATLGPIPMVIPMQSYYEN